jgi:hypothetical protein
LFLHSTYQFFVLDKCLSAIILRNSSGVVGVVIIIVGRKPQINNMIVPAKSQTKASQRPGDAAARNTLRGPAKQVVVSRGIAARLKQYILH